MVLVDLCSSPIGRKQNAKRAVNKKTKDKVSVQILHMSENPYLQGFMTSATAPSSAGAGRRTKKGSQ
jgi:hypothetical protein